MHRKLLIDVVLTNPTSLPYRSATRTMQLFVNGARQHVVEVSEDATVATIQEFVAQVDGKELVGDLIEFVLLSSVFPTPMVFKTKINICLCLSIREYEIRFTLMSLKLLRIAIRRMYFA